MIEVATCMIQNQELSLSSELVLFKMNGSYYTTGAVVAKCLEVTPNNVSALRNRYIDEFDRSLSVNAIHAKDEVLSFLGQHRERFLVERLRQDMCR